jgi:hypothetical protein
MKSNKKDAVVVSSYVDGRLKKIAKALRFSDSELWEIGFNKKLSQNPYDSRVIDKLIQLKEDKIIELQEEILLLKECHPKLIPMIETTPKKEIRYYCIPLKERDATAKWIPESTYKKHPEDYQLVQEA